MRTKLKNQYYSKCPPILYLLAMTLCLLQTSCNSFFSKDICEVCQNPSDYPNSITISGTVKESSAILGYSLYTLKDNTKECILMVLSEKISPTTGKSIKVKGTLKEISNTNNDRKLIFIEEGVDFEKIRSLLSSSIDLLFNQ